MSGKKRHGATAQDGTLLVGDVRAPVSPSPPSSGQRPELTDAWLASFKRTSALVKMGSRWTAYVEDATGTRYIDDPYEDVPRGVWFDIRDDGVHVMHVGEYEHQPSDDKELRFLPLAP